MKKSLVHLAAILALGWGTITTQAQTANLLLGFNDAAGPASAQNDYVIDLGITGSNLLLNAIANGGSTNLTGVISSTTFNTAFGNDANALNDVATGIVGGNSSVNPEQLYMTAASIPRKFTSTSEFNNSIAAAISPLVGEYASTSSSDSAGWSQIIAVSPTQFGSEPSGTSLAAEANESPMGSLVSGIITLNLYENTESTGLHQTVNGWVQLGIFTINVNTHNVSFSIASAAPAPTISSVSSTTATNGFSPLTVVFTDTSTGSITNWVWNFGNGTIITNTTGASVTNTYMTSGNYTVTLTVYGPGGTNTMTLANYIVTLPAPHIVSGFTNSHFTLNGTNCPVGTQYRVLSSTNLALPLNQWQPVFTNTFSGTGSFSYTNSSTNAVGFFKLISP